MGLTGEKKVDLTSETVTATNSSSAAIHYMNGHCSRIDPESSAATAAASVAINKEEPLFQIKKWNLIALWKWDVHSDVCAICRANVMEACPKCQSENKTSDCVIVWGTCNHSFHNCCIVKWIKRNNRCPLCQQEWRNSRKRQLN